MSDIDMQIETLVTFICYRDHDASAPCEGHEDAAYATFGRLRTSRNRNAKTAVIQAAKRHGAWGLCDWCGTGPLILAIDSTAGKRCAKCVEKPLCDWCGEAEGKPHDDGGFYCDDHANESDRH